MVPVDISVPAVPLNRISDGRSFDNRRDISSLLYWMLSHLVQGEAVCSLYRPSDKGTNGISNWNCQCEFALCCDSTAVYRQTEKGTGEREIAKERAGNGNARHVTNGNDAMFIWEHVLRKQKTMEKRVGNGQSLYLNMECVSHRTTEVCRYPHTHTNITWLYITWLYSCAARVLQYFCCSLHWKFRVWNVMYYLLLSEQLLKPVSRVEQFMFDSKLRPFWILSIIRYSKNYRTEYFPNWTPLPPQMEGRHSIFRSLRRSWP
jgi:hypothetical protein